MGKLPKRFPCSKCQLITTTKQNLSRHMLLHAEYVQRAVCSVCAETFANETNLRIHFDRIHPRVRMPKRAKFKPFPTKYPYRAKSGLNILRDSDAQSDNEAEFHGFDETVPPVQPVVAVVDQDADGGSAIIERGSLPPAESPSGVQTRRDRQAKPVVQTKRSREPVYNRNASLRSHKNTPEANIYEFHEEETMATPVGSPQETQPAPESNEVTAEKDESPKNVDEQPDEPIVGDGDNEKDMTMAVEQIDAQTQSGKEFAKKQDKKETKSRSKKQWKLRLNLKPKSSPVKKANRRALHARNEDELKFDTGNAATADAFAPDPIRATRRLKYLHANLSKNSNGPIDELTQNTPLPIAFVDIAVFTGQSN